MKLVLVHTGKTRPAYLEAACSEYYKRIGRYINFKEVILKDLKIPGKPDINDIKKKEGDMLLKMIRPADFLLLFDKNGISHTSESFSSLLEKFLMGGKNLFFVTGGAYGFSKEVYERSDYKLSLSSMTFSHQMVRLLVAEQLYRAFTIINGKPYHHAGIT